MDDGRISAMSAHDYLAMAREALAAAAAQMSAYENWSDEFSRAEARNAWRDTRYRPWARRLESDDLLALTEAERRSLGFGHWDDGLWLIPLWAWNYIADGVVLTSINGDTRTKGADDIDLDVRFGCVAYGIDYAAEAAH